MKNEIITMYELIGLIKDGKAPRKIKYHNEIYYWSFDTYTQKISTPDNQYSLFQKYRIDYCLNETVEILPEENSEWEDIKEIKHNGKKIYNSRTNAYNTLNSKEKNIFIPLINQLIKNQKYLKERLNKDE